MSEHVYAVIMAGGSGTRFWPVSRGQRPKQLVRIVGDTTMIQATVARLQPAIPPERTLVITTAALVEETRRQLPMLKPEHIIPEPVGRDTAPCVCLAAMIVKRIDPEAVMVLLPADATISPAVDFQRCLMVGAEAAADRSLVTYGIEPRFAATGYGYVHVADEVANLDGIAVHKVESFKEKPEQDVAEQYVADGNYLWNSGIFTWRCDVVLEQLAEHTTWLVDGLAAVEAAWDSDAFDSVLAESYGKLKKISIDFALMEHATDIKVVRANFEWDDVGSWDALYDHLPADEHGVIQRGEGRVLNCSNSMIINESQQFVAAVGLDDVSIVVTDDATLVCAKGASQSVKDIYNALKDQGRDELL